MKKRILAILACVFMLINVFAFSACNNGTLESGFKPGSSAPGPSHFAAYRSDKTEFDIDDVTLDFYYGGYYPSGIEFTKTHAQNYPVFEVYFVDDADGSKYFIKRVEENFVSEKYSCELLRDENWYITEIKFNHSETITIPKEIFTKESGKIYFQIHGVNVHEQEQEPEKEPKVHCIVSNYIFYKVTEGKVILSDKEFK